MKYLLIPFSILALSACSSEDLNDINDVAGIWAGQSKHSDNESYDVIGFIASNGDFRMVADDGSIQKGTFSITDDVLTASIVELYDGRVYTGEISATFSGSQISGDASQNGNVFSSITLNYLDDSEDGASFSDVEGSYVDDNAYYSFSFDSDGAFTGSDDFGCQYNGSLGIQDSNVNVYDISFILSACDNSAENGIYSGLASYVKEFNTDLNKSLALIVDDGQYGNSIFLRKE